MRSATSRNANSTLSPLFALVSTYFITPFCLHHSSASSRVTCRLSVSSLPDVDGAIDAGAKSLLLPTRTTTMPSSAIWRRSFSQLVTDANVFRRVMSKTSNAPLAPRKYDLEYISVLVSVDFWAGNAFVLFRTGLPLYTSPARLYPKARASCVFGVCSSCWGLDVMMRRGAALELVR